MRPWRLVKAYEADFQQFLGTEVADGHSRDFSKAVMYLISTEINER